MIPPCPKLSKVFVQNRFQQCRKLLIPRQYREDFDLTRSEYAKAFLELTVGSKSVTDYLESDSVEAEADAT